MVYQPVPNVVSVEIRQELFGQNIENILHFVSSTAVTPGGMLDLASGVAAWVIAKMSYRLSNELRFRELYLRDLTVAAGAELTSVFGSPVTGQQGFPSVPAGTCFAMSFRTGLAGRSFRGRSYVSGLTRPSVIGNQLDPATAGGFVLDWSTLIDDTYVPIGWKWVVVSRVQNGVVLPTGVATPIETVTYADLNLDSQRRRLTGRGN